MDIQMKSAGFRIRVEPELREAFVSACKAGDQSAAQVLRSFMRNYVDEAGTAMQGDLFVAEEPATYSNNKYNP
jgi:hypothetical protein